MTVKLIQLPPRDEPTFRFHGKTPPEAGSKTPILNQAPDSQVDEAGIAHLHLYDPIDSWGGDWGVSASEFRDALNQVKDAKQITLHVNSPGGEVWEGVAILNQLRQHPAAVTAVVDGIAASAASFICCGVDNTVMAKNAQMMIHDARGMVIGNAKDMHDFGNVLDKISDNIASIYADKSGGSVADWRKAMLDESWYNDSEAVDAGLADEVAESPAVANDFDLSLFRHQGRGDAPAPPIPAAAATVAGPTLDLYQRRHRLVAARYALNH